MRLPSSSKNRVYANAIDRIHDAIVYGASTRQSAINPTQRLPAMSTKNRSASVSSANTNADDLANEINSAPRNVHTNANFASTASDSLLHSVTDISDIEDELQAGEYIKKPELVKMGAFNIIGASRRKNTYRGTVTDQIVFEVQLLEGEYRGATALCSMDENPVRMKYFNAVKNRGGIGPVRLAKIQTGNGADAYVFAKLDGTLISKPRAEEADSQEDMPL